MTFYLLCAVLFALAGSELFSILTGTHLMSSEDRALKEASEYTIIDRTPPEELC